MRKRGRKEEGEKRKGRKEKKCWSKGEKSEGERKRVREEKQGRKKRRKKLSLSRVQTSKKRFSMLVPLWYEGQEGGTK